MSCPQPFLFGVTCDALYLPLPPISPSVHSVLHKHPMKYLFPSARTVLFDPTMTKADERARKLVQTAKWEPIPCEPCARRNVRCWASPNRRPSKICGPCLLKRATVRTCGLAARDRPTFIGTTLTATTNDDASLLLPGGPSPSQTTISMGSSPSPKAPPTSLASNVQCSSCELRINELQILIARNFYRIEALERMMADRSFQDKTTPVSQGSPTWNRYFQCPRSAS